MASQKQIEANRLNAKKSTGPVTPEGKAKSRFNALKAGIDADAEVIPGEDPAELAALANEYYQRFLPDRPEHYALVDALITNDWLLRRLRRIEGQLWKQEVANARERSSFKPGTPLACALPSVEDSLTRLQRRMDSADRAYHRALNQIRRLQQAALKPFELEPLPDRPAEPAGTEPPPPSPGEPPEPPTQSAPPPSNQQHSSSFGFVPSISVTAQSAPGGAGLSLPAPRQSAASRPRFRYLNVPCSRLKRRLPITNRKHGAQILLTRNLDPSPRLQAPHPPSPAPTACYDADQMKKRAWLLGGLSLTALLLIRAQDMRLRIAGGVDRLTLALPDLRGSGDSQAYMDLVNKILWDDIAGSGSVKLAPKTMYPPAIPQQPQDLLTSEPQSPAAGGAQGRSILGRRLSDWSSPPVSADYLAFAYAGAQNGVFVLYGWMYDVKRSLPAGVQAIGSRYVGALTEEGARKAAHEFAADIIRVFGGRPVDQTHIYFTSDRTGHKEIWAMDPDGRNQRQITRFNFIAQYASVSPDGSKIAFTAWRAPGANPRVFVFSVDPVRDLGFYNQNSSMNVTPSFTPDGRQIFYVAAVGNARRIFASNLDGSNLRPITSSEFDDAEPKVNPRTGQQIVFSSGRSGPQQVYVCNIDGSDIQKLTDGTGEASNASWHPEGQSIAFAWTRGYRAGQFNIFLMDVSSRQYVQLTHDAGSNENPSWDPGGAHIVFGSKRSGSSQIWTMLADGSDLRQLTTAGNNTNPAWGQ